MTLETRELGNSGLRITPLVFGAWAIGGWMWGGSDEKEARSAIHASIDAGVNMIDTAAVYGMGASEEIVGKAIKGKRDRVLLATKCGRSWNSSQGSMPFETVDPAGKKVTVRSDSRPENIIRECEDSLKRLGVDVIDLYQIHWPDLTYPIDDSMRAMESLKKAGKIRSIGVRNFSVEQLETAALGGRVDSLQPPYSLLQRQIESAIVPYCQSHHVGIICYSPMERGLLTGAVGPERKFPPDDHRSTHRLFTIENRKKVMSALESIKPIADRLGASFAQLAIRWAIDQPGITAAIVGARDATQAVHNIGALQLKLEKDDRERIGAVFARCSHEMGL